MLGLLLHLAALSHLSALPVIDPLANTCTVTGPTVIDFSGHVGSIRDRCVYALMAAPGLRLLASFQERRRRDISFLDRVIIRVDGSTADVNLGPGRRVQVNKETLTLSSSSQVIHGVELSTDSNGLIATMAFSNYTTSVWFDGTSALIHVTGPGPQQGLCVNSSSSMTEVRVSEFSSDSCETQYSEPADDQINCSAMTSRCNHLKGAPFTSCHGLVNPQPHAAACADTLCRYPAVDGLPCQFLEVYVRACGLYSNNTLDGWRSETSCLPTQDCQDTCSAHEFCGEDISGRPGCLCRAEFAARYRASGALGDPTVCEESTASVSLAGCLLAEKGVNHSFLHLNDRSCMGQMDERTHMVTFGFNTSHHCGTVISVTGQKIIYKNTIKTDNSSMSGLISRHDPVNIDFSCFYSQPDVSTMTFKLKGGAAMQQIVSGSWNYSLSTSFCSDLACTKPIDFSKGIELGQTVYMSVDAQGLDTNFITMVTESCWATNTAGGSGGLRYDMVTNGCGSPQDESVKVVSNGKGGSVLAFEIFQFKGKNKNVFLNCKLKLCLRSNPSCQPKCQRGQSRKRRSVRTEHKDENPALVTVAWGV